MLKISDLNNKGTIIEWHKKRYLEDVKEKLNKLENDIDKDLKILDKNKMKLFLDKLKSKVEEILIGEPEVLSKIIDELQPDYEEIKYIDIIGVNLSNKM